MSSSADNDIINLNFRYRNAENDIIFALEISKDKNVSDLENEVRELGPINRDDFLHQICPEKKPMRTEDRIFFLFNETPDDEDRIQERSQRICDEDEELIKRRMHVISSTTSSNEAVRWEYISVILYASIFIARRITEKRITLDPQFKVVGEEASSQVDYVIKKIIDVVNEELIAMTECKQKDSCKM